MAEHQVVDRRALDGALQVAHMTHMEHNCSCGADMAWLCCLALHGCASWTLPILSKPSRAARCAVPGTMPVACNMHFDGRSQF